MLGNKRGFTYVFPLLLLGILLIGLFVAAVTVHKNMDATVAAATKTNAGQKEHPISFPSPKTSLPASPSPVPTSAPTTSPSPRPTVVATPATPRPTTTAVPPVNSGNPFQGMSLYVFPDNNAQRTASNWRAEGRTADADNLMKIGDSAWSMWAVGGDPYGAVNDYVSKANNAGAMPVIVAYNIPGRDCNQYSAGGATYEGYKSWITKMADAIGNRRAAVILEPDTLGLDCLQNDTTYSLMRFAVDTLEAKPATAVYIEAATWVDANTMASRLQNAGIGKAQGFAINTSGYNTTDNMLSYGNSLASRTGKHFVIDTSRNGNGPYDQSQPEPWCNPPDRALGQRPTTSTGQSNVDAYLWIKPPGESDGTCRGGPSAGQWWPEYALGLAQRASY